MILLNLFWALAPLVSAQGGLVINPKKASNAAANTASVPLDLSHLVNNKAFGLKPGEANFDGSGNSYPAQYIPPAKLAYGGINYNFPQYKAGANDNVQGQGQTLSVPQGRYFSVHLLAAAQNKITAGYVTVTYSDKTTYSGPLLVDPYVGLPYPFGGDLIFPYHFTSSSIDYNRSMVYQTVNWLDATKEVVSLQLPNVNTIHVFAASLVPATGSGVSLEVEYARSTQLWIEGTNKVQIIEVIVNNVGTQWVLASNKVQLTVSSKGLTTVTPGVINRLRPGDQAIIQIGVVNTAGTAQGSTGSATVTISGKGIATVTSTFNAVFGIAQYDTSYASIYSHESPNWYNKGKFGIFIHWGVYSVPGWGNVGKREGYAEWYWWYQNLGKNYYTQTYQYNEATYGTAHSYDDFIQDFTPSAWSPKDWVDLFAASGATYFVQVSKHHDGFAIYDLPATVSKRTSVAQHPNRNLMKELFDAAVKYQPQLHRASYYSLPEWFNPAYTKYGFGAWPGGNARNPYTGAILPYTGYVPVNDYVQDIILPSMQALQALGTEIMWCDVGGPNATAQFAADFYNANAAQGRQVLIDNRCGLPGDFDTPEYATYASVQPRKWESNLGMDPFSYGYNRATPDSAYMTPQKLISSLIDTVSKNGNFLLDVGPTANGTIVQVEQDTLKTAGVWIKSHAEAIFDTTYWFITPQEGHALRFTQNLDAFYITSLSAPPTTLTIKSVVPYFAGDKVTVVGGRLAGTVVPSQLLSDGSLQLTISQAVISADQYAWVFKIPFGG